MIADGIHPGLSRARYDTIERVNFSSLKWMAESPKHYRYHKLNKTPDSDPKALGRAVHIAVFEPERFQHAVAKWDGGNRRGKDWDKFCDEHEGQELLTEKAWDTCMAIQAAVRDDVSAQQYLQGGRGELTLLWTATALESGEEFPAKMRMDFDAQLALTDLKTTHNGEADAFGRQAFGLHYDAQAAWYSDGYRAATGKTKPSVLVSVESSPPCDVTVFTVPEEAIELGRAKYQRWLDKLAWCRKHSLWPGRSGGTVMELRIPQWLLPDDDEIGDFALKEG